MLLSVRMPRQRMDDSFAGDFLFKVSLGGGSLAFGEPLMAKNEQTMLPVFASDKIYLY